MFRALVMNGWVQKVAENFLTNWTTFRFSRRTWLHGVG